MEETNVIKLRFLKNGIPAGQEYTYLTPCEVAAGDYVEAPSKSTTSTAVVTAVNVPEAEIAPFRDRVKSIVGKANVGRCAYCHKVRPMSELEPGEISYIGEDPYTGKDKVIHETNLYCKDGPCHGYDQMGHEG